MLLVSKKHSSFFAAVFLFLSIALVGCNTEEQNSGILPENTPLVKLRDEAAAQSIPATTPTATATATATVTATATAVATATSTPNVTEAPTSTPTVTAVVTATSTPNVTEAPTSTPTQTAPTTTPTPPPIPMDERAQEPYLGIWLSREDIGHLPMEGPAWDSLLHEADRKTGEPDLNDQDDPVNVRVLAKALVFARTGEQKYRDDVVEALEVVTYDNTEKGGNTLALGRELVAYVIAADLISLPEHAPQFNLDFEEKLRQLLTKRLDGRTLRSTHEERPNNWGTHAGASRAAVALYLGDMDELQRTAQIFKGWMGDRETYKKFIFGSDLSWQCDPQKPVGINPTGCEKEGHNINGAQPEEMRRGAEFQWPPEETGYAWEALQGALVQAEILHRAGYDTWEWEDQAILRAAQFLYDIGWEPDGDDEWQVWLLNYAYCISYPTNSPVRAGKNMGWTDWTHAACP